jgi:hypothetical protein
MSSSTLQQSHPRCRPVSQFVNVGFAVAFRLFQIAADCLPPRDEQVGFPCNRLSGQLTLQVNADLFDATEPHDFIARANQRAALVAVI